MKKVLAVFGTRPEAIKMAPVIAEFKKSRLIELRICVTAQHRAMLDQALALFAITPDHDLDLMRPDQSLDELAAKLLLGIGRVLDAERPDLVLVQGDTTTTLAGALAAFYRRIPVGHVEAGLRSGSLAAPWPEELNRRMASLTAQFHFAPTEHARQNLLREGVGVARIHLTGNTGIDALLQTLARLKLSPDAARSLDERFRFLDPALPLVLVTAHRRESFGDGFARICGAIMDVATRHAVQIVYPVHPNPAVAEPVTRLLQDRHPRIHVIEPLDYEPFVYLMARSHFIITDSGGVQEEAPSLGKPVLVMRDITERPEAVEAGTVMLVGTSRQRIVEEAGRLLADQAHYARMAQAANPYGDGHAAERIRAIIEKQA